MEHKEIMRKIMKMARALRGVPGRRGKGGGPPSCSGWRRSGRRSAHALPEQVETRDGHPGRISVRN